MELIKNKKFQIGIGILVLIIIFIIYIIMNSKIEENTIIIEEDTKTTEEEEPSAKIKVHIAGYVLNEGIIELEEGARIQDAIEAAGGLTEDADIEKVNLAYKIEDGQKIYIPNKQEAQEEDIIIVKNENGEGIISGEEQSEKVNINTANQTELETLPGIGPSTALKIIEYRELNGKFRDIEELKNVPGIGEAKFKNIENAVTI